MSFKLNRVVVTGGCGFVGSHIVCKLVKLGYQVTVIDNLSTGSLENIKNLNVNFVHLDILKKEKLDDVFNNVRPDYIIHQAAQTSVQESITNFVNDSEINIKGTLNLLELYIKYNMKKIIFASSAAIYGEPKCIPVTSKHPLSPASPYGLSKLSAENYIELANKLYGVNYTILRYSNVYGPRQRTDLEGGVVSIFIDKLRKGMKVNIYGDGLQTRDFIYVEDVAEANIKALSNGNQKKMNVSSNKEISIKKLFLLISSMLNSIDEPIFCAERKGDIKNSVLCNCETIKELEWSPNYSLEEGLKETISNLYS